MSRVRLVSAACDTPACLAHAGKDLESIMPQEFFPSGSRRRRSWGVLYCADGDGGKLLMATRVKPRSDLHRSDLYAWSKAQADLLRAGRFAELDLPHLIEEIEDVGGAMRRAARNRIRTIIEHLLKLEHSPAKEPRAGWRATIRSQRVRLRDALTPTLRREVEPELNALYDDARGLADGALRDHSEDAAADALPLMCPYDFEQITGDWMPG
jgi:Domain of unknown function DUF29